MRILLAALLTLPVIVHASPGATVIGLMAEPASMFDVGMIRLHRVAAQVAKTLPDRGNMNVAYQRDRDRFLMGYSDVDFDAGEDEMRSTCETALDRMTNFVGKSIPQIFQPAGTEPDRAESEELRRALLPMFEFYCVFYGRSTEDVRFRATRTPW